MEADLLMTDRLKVYYAQVDCNINSLAGHLIKYQPN